MKILIVLVGALILMGAAGCGTADESQLTASQPAASQTAASPTNSKIVPDISEVIARQSAGMGDITSCKASVHLEIAFTSSDSSVGNILVTADMRSVIDSLNRLMSSTVSTKVVMKDSKKEMEQRITAAKEKVYLKDSLQGQWQVKTLDQLSAEKLWNEQELQLTGSKYAGLMSLKNLVYAGKENSNGHSCWVLKQPLDQGSLAGIVPDLQQQLPGIPGLSKDQLGKVIKNAETAFLVDEQSYYLREFRLNAQVEQSVSGQAISGTITQYCRYDAFNQPVSVQIPEVK